MRFPFGLREKYLSEDVDCVIIVVFLHDDGHTINYYSYGLFWSKNKALKMFVRQSTQGL